MHDSFVMLYSSVSYSLQQDCPNGRLTPAKFVDMYKMFFPSGNAEEFCDHVFRTFDMDKNGYIDFKVSAVPVEWTPCSLAGNVCLCLQYRRFFKPVIWITLRS
jgi:hypothetical protein